ncbi:MAG: hypothetical protein WA303_01690 [Bradyrhizobium sp.]|jgi:hypothetical protein
MTALLTRTLRQAGLVLAVAVSVSALQLAFTNPLRAGFARLI